MKKIDGLSMNIEQTEREKLASVFPQCFVEGKLDIDKLLSLCGEYITRDFEKYEFTWKGKSECLPLAQRRSTATLRPCPEESVNFDTTQNVYIEGDNLEVLKLLQTSYYRQVKMMYIDPPYNTGHDFVYEDDFADTLARYKEVTSQTTKSNPESMGRFHTNWLNMMYPRLRLAANLLRDDGVICISIDDNEVHNLRKICDEVFGEENFIVNIVWQKAYVANMTAKFISNTHDHLVVYAKSFESAEIGKFPRTEEQIEKFQNPDNDPRGPWKAENLSAGKYYSAGQFEITGPDGSKYLPPSGRYWRCNEARYTEWLNDGRIWFGKDGTSRPMLKKYLNEMEDGLTPDTWWEHKTSGSNKEATLALKDLFSGKAAFDTPKPVKLLSRLLTLFAGRDGLVLDFFSGSATTAHAVMQLNAEDGGNRRFILVQLPERCSESSEAFKAGYKNICEIGKERIRRAGKKLTEENGQLSLLEAAPLDTGFKVFKLDSSNLKMWDSSRFPEDDLLSISNRLNDMIDRVKPDRSDLDVVYEIMLKLGVPLTYSVTPIPLKMENAERTRKGKEEEAVSPNSPCSTLPSQLPKTAYSIGDECLLIICLADNLTTEMIEEMADYSPGQIVLAEHALADLSAMRNAHFVLRDRNIELKLV